MTLLVIVILTLITLPLLSLSCVTLFHDKGHWYAHWQASTDEYDAWRHCFVPLQHWLRQWNLPSWVDGPLGIIHHVSYMSCVFGPGMFQWSTGPLRYFVHYYLLR